MDNTLIKDLTGAVAWPIVVLICAIFLGPCGLLERVVNKIADSLYNLTQSVKDFKEITASAKAEFHEMTAEIRQELDAFKKETESFSDAFSERIADVQGKLSVALIQIQEDIASGDGVKEAPLEYTSAEGDEHSYQLIASAWYNLSEAIQSALGYPKDFDRRQVAAMAYRLVDKRRRTQIDYDTANRIAEVQAKYKRFLRLQNTEKRFTGEECISFSREIDEARNSILRGVDGEA